MCLLWLTRVPHDEQNLLSYTFTGHLSSPSLSNYSVFSLLCSVLWTVVLYFLSLSLFCHDFVFLFSTCDSVFHLPSLCLYTVKIVTNGLFFMAFGKKYCFWYTYKHFIHCTFKTLDMWRLWIIFWMTQTEINFWPYVMFTYDSYSSFICSICFLLYILFIFFLIFLFCI